MQQTQAIDLKLHSEYFNGFCYPDWDTIRQQLPARQSPTERRQAHEELAVQWVQQIQLALEPGYQIYQTKNFILLSNLSTSEAIHAGKFAEEALSIIFEQLEGVAQMHEQGKHVCFIFDNHTDYIRYTEALYAEDEEIPTSGGMCIHGTGYVHFTFPTSDFRSYKSVLTHELTHACLAHKEIPYWLNEAIAMRMEFATKSTAESDMDQILFQRHQQHWNAFTIQQFWSGESWQIAGEANELSYGLARVLWRKIEIDLGASPQELVQFLSTAEYFDAGDSACQILFGLSLADLITAFLGTGNWLPNMELWHDDAEHDGSSIAALEGVQYAPIENISSARWHHYSTSRGTTPEDVLTRITDILHAKPGRYSSEETEDAIQEGLWQWLCDESILFSITPLFLDHVLDIMGKTTIRHPHLLHFIKTCRELGTGSIHLSTLEVAQNSEGKLPIYRIEDVLAKYGLSAK